ncbi:MAG: AAA family ATPase [Candidatus Absconditabacteria bacterium]
MEIKKINTERQAPANHGPRPISFEEFIGQEDIKTVIQTAIDSAKKREGHIGHMLFSGPSGFGKTTMAGIIAKQANGNIKTVTGYAISKPAEIVSILNSLETGDLLFIDEIHRLRPNIEEVLYIAMEDFVIDMVMPEGGNVRIPINPFTLIWATTKSESLSQPIKNRFVYHFHFMEYNSKEKQKIIQRYLTQYHITTSPAVLEAMVSKVDAVPREIHNFCIKLRDFVITTNKTSLEITPALREAFLEHSKIEEGGTNPLHARYLEILREANRPLGLKTIAIQLGINEKAVEEDIEPLLMKLGKIEKTPAGRVII